MKEWEYDELTEFIIRSFNKFKEEEGRDNEGSAFRCFYEFENVINDGYTEKCVVYSTIGMLLAENKDVPQHRYEKIGEVLNSFDKSKVIGNLPQEDVEKLEKQIKKVKELFEELHKKDNITKLDF